MSKKLKKLLGRTRHRFVWGVLLVMLLVVVAGCGTQQTAVPTEASFPAESEETVDEDDEVTPDPSDATPDPNEETPEPNEGTPEPRDDNAAAQSASTVSVPPQNTDDDSFSIAATRLEALEPENQYLLDVSLTNSSGADVTIDTDALALVGTDGTVYTPVPLPENINPAAVDITLEDDTSLRGFAQFELPPNAQISHVRWCLDADCETVIGSIILNLPTGMGA